ncbi:YdeI/OmpD-associated family protein [Hyphomicrobium sp.]|uniref:YdeI/OmpD-associated family protein n=1 Tax=Hyphomicrobium sp. TaxID=82 RepID=UPI002D784C25|nr:YdeI/OmpD-associated family protein [Hyphomicrobium sp.]HET6389551.1 YdeI/OmpD-associated family protein [Hyphomicrobium sp.]
MIQHAKAKSKRNPEIEGGVVHALPDDLAAALRANADALATWRDITPLARNEWICWILSAKKAETRAHRITWGCSNLEAGKRRPCCWPGCKHR